MNNLDKAVQAIINGDAGTLKNLLLAYPALIKARSESPHQSTLLHYVAANGIESELQKTPPNAVEIAQILIDAGTEIDATAETYGGGPNQTTLCLLISSSHPAEAGVKGDLVRLLCESGAKVNGLLDDGAPMITALAFWSVESFDVLAEQGARIDNFVFAAASGDLDLTKKHINIPYQPQISTKDWIAHHQRLYQEDSLGCAFVKAAMCGHLPIVEYLLAQGADIDTKYDYNRTALHEAAWTGQHKVVEFLLQNGADKSIRDTQHDSTPSGWAAHAGHQKLAAVLA